MTQNTMPESQPKQADTLALGELARKLTPAQRRFLEQAARSPTGNPWPLIGIRQRSGGAMSRMFEQMKARGWFDANNCITDEGRATLKALEAANSDAEGWP